MYTTQTKKQPEWVDENGNKVPYKNLKKSEIVLEKVTGKIGKHALAVNSLLSKVKAEIRQLVNEGVEAVMAEYDGTKKEFKGNYTLYNFDRSVCVRVKVARPIKFDEMIISLAKSKISEFLAGGITAKNEFIKEIVLSAFETRNGQLDVDKILSLRRYRDRVQDAPFLEALDLIDQAIRKPSTATYYQVMLRNDEGKYDTIKLDFSRI